MDKRKFYLSIKVFLPRILCLALLFFLDLSAAKAQWSSTNMIQGRAKPVAVTVGTKVFFAGSYVSWNPNVIDVFNSSDNTWTTLLAPNVNFVRSFGAGASYNNKIYLATGDIVDIYDDVNQTWDMDTLSQNRSGMAAASVGSFIIFAGGQLNSGTSNVVDIFNTITNHWSTATLSKARTNMVVTVLGKKVFFAGGYETYLYPNGFSDESAVVDIYDSETDNWSTATLSQPRFGLAAASAGSKAIFGGGSKGAIIFDVVDIYDAQSDAWSTSKLSHARSGLAATALGNQVIFAGGTDATAFSKVVDIYDVATNAWSTSSLTYGRSALTGVSNSSEAFFAGGSMGVGPTSIVEIYNANCIGFAVSVTPSQSICAGSSVVLQAANANKYVWSPSNDLSSTTESRVVAKPSSTVTYTVKGTSAEGCVDTETVTITVLPVPDFTLSPASITMCSGSEVTASCINGGVVTYQWSPSEGLSSTNSNFVTISPNASITYMVIGTNLAGCVDTVYLEVSVVPSNVIKPTISVNQSDPLIFVLSSSSSQGNRWFRDGELLLNEINQTLTVTTPGAYTVQVTENNCLSPLSDPFDVIITGMQDELSVMSFQLYPVPAAQTLRIEWLEPDLQRSIEINITDILGRSVLRKSILQTNQNLDISDLFPGSYILLLERQGKIHQKRFIKNK